MTLATNSMACGVGGNGSAVSVAPFPQGGLPLHNSSGNVANATATATLAATPGVTNYLTCLMITSGGATVGAVVPVTVTGLVGGTLFQTYGAVAGALVSGTPLVLNFNPPVPAAGPNTAIVVSLPNLGGGNTNATVSLFGYQV